MFVLCRQNARRQTSSGLEVLVLVMPREWLLPLVMLMPRAKDSGSELLDHQTFVLHLRCPRSRRLPFERRECSDSIEICRFRFDQAILQAIHYLRASSMSFLNQPSSRGRILAHLH